MVDYNKLRKKFPNVKSPRKISGSKAAIKAINQEYAKKRAELGLGAPKFKRGFMFYTVVILGLMILGSLVLSATGKGGKKHISKNLINADKALSSLAEALGRYKFHVGDYPSNEEGLAALSEITPRKKGWVGPYCSKIVKDPWGEAYYYDKNLDGEHPILLSGGPDRKMGTADDLKPDEKLFFKPFEDTTWTNKWAPYTHRGILVAPDKKTKAMWEAQMRQF